MEWGKSGFGIEWLINGHLVKLKEVFYKKEETLPMVKMKRSEYTQTSMDCNNSSYVRRWR